MVSLYINNEPINMFPEHILFDSSLKKCHKIPLVRFQFKLFEKINC